MWGALIGAGAGGLLNYHMAKKKNRAMQKQMDAMNKIARVRARWSPWTNDHGWAEQAAASKAPLPSTTGAVLQGALLGGLMGHSFPTGGAAAGKAATGTAAASKAATGSKLQDWMRNYKANRQMASDLGGVFGLDLNPIRTQYHYYEPQGYQGYRG